MIQAAASTEDYHTLAETAGKAKAGTAKVAVPVEALRNVLHDYVRLQKHVGPDYQTRDA